MSRDNLTDTSRNAGTLTVSCECPECKHKFDQAVDVEINSEVEVTIET